MEASAVIGIDLAKSVFQVHGVDAQGQVVVRKRLSPAKLLPFFAKLREPSTAGRSSSFRSSEEARFLRCG